MPHSQVDSYRDFLQSKRIFSDPVGFDVAEDDLHDRLFPFQRRIVRWGIGRGRAAFFCHTGLGKTAMQLEWARHIHARTGRNVLILAPLAVGQQTVAEGRTIGLDVTIARSAADVRPGITIANYERLHLFDPAAFGAIVLDESSAIKGLDSAIRQQLNVFVRDIPYRLACTATPAPNDLVELANHAEFLGVMQVKEVKALFFTQDGNSAQDWRLKGHAKADFWRWLASWSVAVRAPSDLGFADDGFALPPLTIEQHTVSGAITTGTLIPIDAITLQERQQARRDSIGERVAMAAALVNSDDQPWIVWTQLNAESEAMTRAIPGAIQVTGSDSIEHKEQAIAGFLDGTYRVLVSKATIAGFGLNLQHCARMVFVGLSDSWEQYFQAVRRCWRFGQTQPVVAHVITAETEGAVVRNIERKERQAAEMMAEVVKHMAIEHEITGSVRNETAYREDVATGPDWTLYLGDSVKVLADPDRIADNSVGLIVTSPPFPGMYVYNNSPHDIGNCTSIDQLMEQLRYMMSELLRVTMPGRTCAIHLTQAVAFKGTDGYIGIKDFRGRVISAMEAVGWIYYGEVTIDKNPQLKAIRTKDRGLLFKTLATDSANMHMALADYLVQFRKPGDNPDPIRAGISAKYGNPNGWITPEEWIEWAAPIWLGDFRSANGIRETDVLNVVQARETDDERHLAPLQLGVIERAVKLWSNPGDLVLDPFAGICSTGYRALQLNRRFVGVELKESYFRSGIKNLGRALASRDQPSLLDRLDAA